MRGRWIGGNELSTRVENCFPWIEDPPKAQRLMDRQLRTRWLRPLRELSRTLNPAHGRIFRGLPIEYYWTVYQSEWATDLMFRSAGELARMYPALVRGAMEQFSSPEVMRFLGKTRAWKLQPGRWSATFAGGPRASV